MNWILIGSISMFCAVGLGAFGSHVLSDKLSEHYMGVFKTAVLYQLIHGIALFIVAWLQSFIKDPAIKTVDKNVRMRFIISEPFPLD